MTENPKLKEACKKYADDHSDSKWNKASELEHAFLAGHSYALESEVEIKRKAQEELLWALIGEIQDADDAPFTKADIEADYYSWFEKLKIITPQSIPPSVVEALIAENPYPESTTRVDYRVWTKCCNRLRELLAAQPIQQGNVGVLRGALQEIVDRWDTTNNHQKKIIAEHALSQSSPSVKEEEEGTETYQEVIKLVRRLESEYSSIYDSAAYIKTHFTITKK